LAVSPFMPIGPARLAEPSPGFEANVAVLALGAVAIVVIVLARATLPALRLASGRSGDTLSTGRSVLAETAARAGFAPPAASGIRMAFEQHHGKRSLPLRSALAGSIVGLAALIAALMFASSLTHLVGVPASYGQRWTVIADSSFGTVSLKEHASHLNTDPEVTGYTGGNYGAVTIEGRDVPAIGLDRLKGDVYPALLGQGRAAEQPNEIVLGTLVMRRLRTSIGRTIPVQLPTEPQPRIMTVVGRAVFPSFGRGSFTTTSIGDGAAVVSADLAPYEKQINPYASEPYNFLLIRLREGPGRAAAEKRLQSWFVDPQCAGTNDCSLRSEQRPIELGVLTRVRSVPLILAGLLALFAVATLGHALLTSVRLRARDLAILKTIGFVRRQIRATVAWQTSTLAATALILGLPLGVIAGRSIWSLFASGLGVPSHPAISVFVIIIAVPAVLVLANVIGAWPARAAARTEAAVVLRTE
ncbi:MAG TPA: ABC transporter permease, partial [Actinomycetota bacterium]|nr:ABC transporter permease [Actinomycetota bacterium]